MKAQSWVKALCASILSLAMGVEVAAQPAGKMDPLYEHRCNRVVDAPLAAAGKDALRQRLIQVDQLYARSMELSAAGDSEGALLNMLAFKQQIASLLAPTHHVFVDAQLRAAALWADRREYPRAFEEIESAVRVREDCLGLDNPFTLEALSMKSAVLERDGQARSALKVAEEVLKRRLRWQATLTADQSQEPGEQKATVVALANVAALAYRVRDYQRAKTGAQLAIENARRLPDDDLQRYELENSAWYCLDRIAYFARDRDGQVSAIRGLEASYWAMRNRLGEEHSRTLPLLGNLGFAVADVDATKAVPILGDYVAMVEQQRLRAPLADERRIMLEGRAGTYQRFAFAAHEAGRTEEAFWGIEWSKARSLRDLVSIKLALGDQSIPAQDRSALLASESKIAALEALAADPQLTKADRDARTVALLEEKKRYGKAFEDAERKSPSLRLAALSRIQRPDNAPSALKPDEVFISYLTRRSNGPLLELLIAILEPDGKLTVAGPTEVLGLESSVESYATILSRAGGLSAVATSGRELWKIGDAFYFAPASQAQPADAESIFEVDPLREMLSKKLLPDTVRSVVSKYKRWVISPAGVLWNLPFEALNDGAGFVLDERTVRYTHSWSMLTLLSERDRTRRVDGAISLLAIGGAKYSDRVVPMGSTEDAFPKWTDLTFSAQELNEVASTFSLVDGETVFRGDRATRQTVADLQLKGTLGRARQIFLSSHGYLNPEDPAASAIVLGRPSTGTEADRYLSARAIAQLGLSAELVVVSSCDSGRGRLASGEGVLGLPFAFFSAGASRTILTLWEVYDDMATASLVGRLMSGLQMGLPPDDALTAAKRLIRKAHGEASWAPFVLIGR